jgi:riboflavin-specific deaminase-like protein
MSPPWRQCFDVARVQAPAFRPFVTAAFALSKDGLLTAVRGQPTPISSRAALEVTHALRAAHDAILVGRGTLEADDPRLTTRFQPGRTGLRAVLDSRLMLSPDARLVRSEERPVVVFTSPEASPSRELVLRGRQVDVERVPRAPGGVALPEVLARLAKRGVRSVMVEGGAEVLESFFTAGLVDFLCLTTSPRALRTDDALACGPVTRAVLDRWAPESTFPAGDDVITVGAVAVAPVEAAG